MPAPMMPPQSDAPANLPTKPSGRGSAFVTHHNDRPVEGGVDPAFGNVTWKTLICSDQTDSDGLVLGVAEFPAHGVLHLHRHAPPEFYFGLTGSGTVYLDGVARTITPGVAVFIPGDVEHGVVADAEGLTFAYGFGVRAFSEVDYRFSG